MLRDCSVPNVQILAAKRSEGSGPGLEPTQTIADFLCRLTKIDPPIFFLENRRKRRFLVILRVWRDRSFLQSAQSIDYEVGTDCGQSGSKGLGGIRGPNLNFFLQQDVASIEARVDPHGRDTGHDFPARDCPLNGCRSAILGQQRRMQVNIAEPG